MGEARGSIFDRKWAILCSELAQSVGTAYSFKDTQGALNRAASAREEAIDCDEPVGETAGNLSGIQAATCRERNSGFAWKIYSASAGGRLHLVEGLASYDSALQLALANLVADEVVEGEISIASLGSSDSLAIAKAKAAITDVDTLIGQGYRGNSAGDYAEAAELFAAAPALIDTEGGEGESTDPGRIHEFTVNRALQLSNLGSFDQADRLFRDAERMATGDPIQSRLARNYQAIDAINRGNLARAAEILEAPIIPLTPAVKSDDASVRIDSLTAAGLNATRDGGVNTVLGQETRLTPAERAQLIDAQAIQLAGTVERLEGRTSDARGTLARAYNAAMRVRDGRVVSIARLRSQILSETALTYEAEGNFSASEGLLRQALSIVETQYPESTSVNVAKARLAGFLTRRGQDGEALSLFRSVVEAVSQSRDSLVGMENLIRPYFDLLTPEGQTPAGMVGELFLASQLVERPGAADTMAQLSRQLQGGDDEASTLFRRSLVLNREIERNRIGIAQLNVATQSGVAQPGLEALRLKQDRLRTTQRELFDALSDYPQYRAVAHRYVSLDDLRATLGANEGYLKLVEASGAIYAVYVSPTVAMGWKSAFSGQELADSVAILRDSISLTVSGTQSTYPFEIDVALELHEALLGPASEEIANLGHLVFEPDGAMLQLPLNLLTRDTAGVEAYHARVEGGGDEYDFTGIGWLGRNTAVSTALSATSFRDARSAPISKAAESFLGLGQNVALGPITQVPGVRSANTLSDPVGCAWPVAAWNQPISAEELRSASGVFGQGTSDLMTGSQFTDAAIMARPDLKNFRIVHFATHGLVVPPQEGCPYRPALLTSFGGMDSDGLLSFQEIFDLELDADLVILSACDTAGQASMNVTREAGVTSGGGQALDGLVRAFIAAGGRQVIASHWPAPDDFNATRRLFTSFYADTGASLGDALKRAQQPLMDDPETAHPFYWAGFAIVGDAGRPVITR